MRLASRPCQMQGESRAAGMGTRVCGDEGIAWRLQQRQGVARPPLKGGLRVRRWQLRGGLGPEAVGRFHCSIFANATVFCEGRLLPFAVRPPDCAFYIIECGEVSLTVSLQGRAVSPLAPRQSSSLRRYPGPRDQAQVYEEQKKVKVCIAEGSS